MINTFIYYIGNISGWLHIGRKSMEIVPGCAIGKGLFASFAGYETTDTIPIRMVTECEERLSRTAI